MMSTFLFFLSVLLHAPTAAFTPSRPVLKGKLDLKLQTPLPRFTGHMSPPMKLLFFNGEDETDQVQQRPLSSGLFSTVLVSATRALEEAPDDWALAYADLSPESEQSTLGQMFLATNLAYTLMGVFLQLQGEVWFGTLTEIASVASFAYHFNQLANPKKVGLVRLSLMIDYVVAAACLGTAFFYMVGDFPSIPVSGLVACVLALLFLGLSWVWEEGLPYCINHGLWHILGSYGGFIIGQAHAAATHSLSI